MENNRLINTGENGGAVGGTFLLNPRPKKCHRANSSAPAASRRRRDGAGTIVRPRGSWAGN